MYSNSHIELYRTKSLDYSFGKQHKRARTLTLHFKIGGLFCCCFVEFLCVSFLGGAGIAQWLEHQTREPKVAGSNPWRFGGRIFFSMVNFLCWLSFRDPFHPGVTAVSRKIPRSFCQKCRWQVTVKYAWAWRMWLYMKWHGAWLYGVHRMRWDGSSFMWHQPCQRCKYTTSVDIKKNML